jgi:hypothetical protein
VTLDVTRLWCATWNSKTRGLRARKLDEMLAETIRKLLHEQEIAERIITVCETLEEALKHTTTIRRIFKAGEHKKEEGVEHGNNQGAAEATGAGSAPGPEGQTDV